MIMNKRKLGLFAGVSLAAVGVVSMLFLPNSVKEDVFRPENVEYEHEEKESEEEQEAKFAPWSEEDALRQQQELAKFSNRKNARTTGTASYGSLKGNWANSAPRNMPGAFKFAEMLDGTDIIYGVTHNHYSGEFNAKSYIFRGSVYNPKTGKKGDDFVRLTGHWPNRYSNLIAHKFNGQVRLIAGVENGPVYFSDDEGQNWTLSSGLPSAIKSTIINRQDEKIYATDGGIVYVSTDGGVSFTNLQTIGTGGDGTLYSPRYDVQSNAEKVYFAREGQFYELNTAKTSFTLKGSYSGAHGSKSFSIGGDSRKLYVTENSAYWVSTNGGTSWTQKYPKGNWYGDRSGNMSAGKFLAASPENPDYVMGGYAQPVFSKDGLNTDNSTNSGWGSYQNGGHLGLTDYANRIRFNYHPDFQAQHFFYNSTGDLFSVGCTDGGMYISYKVWKDHPTDNGGAYTNTDYANAHFININTINTPCALIYRHNMFTGNKDKNHIVFSTQDQGTQDYILGTTGDMLNVYQTIGGDGPPLGSADGNWVWKWKRQGSQVWMPYELYDGAGNRRKIGTVSNAASAQTSVTFTQSTNVGWVQAYIDNNEPNKRIWMLNKDLARAEVNGSSLTGTTISKGTGHQVCAFTQATVNPEIVFFLQEGKVYKSTNRGDSFGNAISTPFTKTSNKQNIGGGWVLPTNNQWVLFAGPSANNVGAILSKDGGNTWKDITGDLPTGDDFQVGGMTGTPDGKYVFAGTDVGPYVFVVAEEKWYPMFANGQTAMFNTTSIEYIASEKIVRFGTWGSGVWDFAIDDNSPKITLVNVSPTYSNCDSLIFTWETANITGTGTVELLKKGASVESWNYDDITKGKFSWFISSDYAQGTDYQLKVSSGNTATLSSDITISNQKLVYNTENLSIDYVDSEHSSSRLASNTIDNNATTFWHTEWSPNQPAFPHEIIFKAKESKNFSTFSYLSRQDGSSNGRVKGYEIYGSNDNKQSWTLLKAGELQNIATMQLIDFDKEMNCDHVKFVMLSEQSNAFYASMAEFGLYTSTSCLVTSTTQYEKEKYVVYPTIMKQGTDITIKDYNGMVKIYSLTDGQLVEQKNVNQLLTTQNLSSGTYILQMNNSSQRIIIQ